MRATRTWTKTAIGKGDGDSLLEPNEKFEITINVSQLATRLAADDEFTIEIKPKEGATTVIQRRTPAVIDKVNDLN